MAKYYVNNLFYFLCKKNKNDGITYVQFNSAGILDVSSESPVSMLLFLLGSSMILIQSESD